MDSEHRDETQGARSRPVPAIAEWDVDDIALGLLRDLSYEPPAGLVRKAVAAFRAARRTVDAPRKFPAARRKRSPAA